MLNRSIQKYFFQKRWLKLLPSKTQKALKLTTNMVYVKKTQLAVGCYVQAAAPFCMYPLGTVRCFKAAAITNKSLRASWKNQSTIIKNFFLLYEQKILGFFNTQLNNNTKEIYKQMENDEFDGEKKMSKKYS